MAHLADLDALRMHAIAFYLSQRRDGTLNRADAALLASAPSRKILRSAASQQHWGLMGLLRRLPDQVLGRAAYKLISEIASNETLVGQADSPHAILCLGQRLLERGEIEVAKAPIKPLDFKAPKTKQRSVRSKFPEALGLRVHRGISWLGRAEEEKTDADVRFILLWVGFNSA